MDQLFSTNDVCEMFKISPRTLQRHVAAGDFPPPRRIYPNGENRWMRKDIDQVFSDMTVAEAYKDSTYYERRAHCA